MLRVDARDVERQAAHFLPDLDAERAGLVLVQRQRLALPVDLVLRRLDAHHAFGAGEVFLEQHDRAEDGAKGFKKGSDKKFHGRF